MKHRVKLAVTTVLISLAGLALMVAQNWRDSSRPIVINLPATAGTHEPAAAMPTLAAAETIAPTTQPIGVTETPTVIDDTTVVHTAKPGETLSGLANQLRNKETAAYRDAIVQANPSLKADPDKLIAGKTYLIPAASDVPETAPLTEAATVPVVAAPIEPTPADPIQLMYTAKSGDTVTNMAGAFLGNADQSHQDTITNANASLKADPDRVVVGQAYKIPVTSDGLSAATVVVKTDLRSAVQPDADQMIKPVAAKTLTYTARAGDTVTSMAIALLGSDTSAARAAIIAANPSLQRNPDKVMAGQNYTIPSPIASIDPR